MEDHSGRFGDFSDSKQIYCVLGSINKQRDESKLCDVTLRIADDHIYAHSNVLAAASPYFDALFSGQELPRMFSQKSPQIIEIHIDGPTDPAYVVAVQRVVDFMYTSEIRLDYAILTQVQEIAKIMQMENVIDFCEMFQQGYCSYMINRQDQILARQTCRDVQIQTDNLTEKPDRREQDFDVFVFNKKGEEAAGVDETWTFSKNFKPQRPKNKPINPTGTVSGKKKRGRPRKRKISEAGEVQTETKDISIDVETMEANEEKENVGEAVDEEEGKKNEESKENVDNKEIPVIAIAGQVEVKKEKGLKSEETVCPKVRSEKTDIPYRVSRSGRVIKPKVFGDGAFLTIKQEPHSDLESDDNSQDDNSVRNIAQPSNVDNAVVNTAEVSNSDEASSDTPTEKVDDEKQSVGEALLVELNCCDKCEFKCVNMKDFNEHQRQHLHTDNMCSFCGWVCETADDKKFQEHVKNHSGPTPFFCNFCCARFKTRTKFLLHLPKHSKNKPFVCEICQAGFKWKHALKNHMIVHKNTKDYLCDICGFSTAHKTQLKAHHLIHTGNTFKCGEPGCDYQATKRTNLKFHQMVHTREKPHQCEVCGTSFSLVKNLKRHMLLHASDRPFKCSSCTFSTTRYDKLREHTFKQHNIGEKPGKKFRLSEYIKMQEDIEDIANLEAAQDIIKAGGDALESLPPEAVENIETIELQVQQEENGTATTQIVNVTSSQGEQIPIAITQVGNELSYEIQQFPIQFVTQEVITDG